MTPRSPSSRRCCLIAVALCFAAAALTTAAPGAAAQPAEPAARLRPGPADQAPAPDKAAPASRLLTVVTPAGLMLEDPSQPMLPPATEGQAGGAGRAAEAVALGLPGALHSVTLPSGGRMRQLLVDARDVQAAPASPSGADLIDQVLADGSHQWVLPQGPARLSPEAPSAGAQVPVVDVPVGANGVPRVAIPAIPGSALVRYGLVRSDKSRTPTR
jgi:hypothetical protein